MKYVLVAVVLFIVGFFAFKYFEGENKPASKKDVALIENQSQKRLPSSTRLAPEIKHHHHVHHFSKTGPAGYTPDQIRSAYGTNAFSGKGAGQIIAIIDADGSPTIKNDVEVFDEKFGLPAPNLKVYYPQGQVKNADHDWALEATLDVEWAHAIAPGAEIALIVASTASYDSFMSAVDYALSLGANQVSMSWGSVEWQGETSYDSHFNDTKASFFASSGDAGEGAFWPAASPNVIGVGGTTLHLNNHGALTQPETAWAGSGGGQSVYETEPGFQNQSQNSGTRGVPDVAYNADPNTGYPIYDSYGLSGQSGWFQVGGTSAGAPQWAALTALAEGQRKSPLGTLGSAIYTLASPTNLSNYFQDIIVGCNGPSSLIACAQPGYDFVTGLGTPHSLPLLKGLASLQ